MNNDGTPLSRISQHRANWYIKRNLVEQTPEGLKLLKPANGPGGSTEIRENKCSCCGEIRKLTRHHIIPECFRKVMSDKHKNYTPHDIAVLCETCHQNYEIHAFALKEQMATRIKNDTLFKGRATTTLGGAFGVLKFENVPQDIRTEAEKIVLKYCGTLDLDQQKRFSIIKNMRKSVTNKSYKAIVKFYGEDKFIKIWKSHFVKLAQPKFLPDEFWKHYEECDETP